MPRAKPISSIVWVLLTLCLTVYHHTITITVIITTIPSVSHRDTSIYLNFYVVDVLIPQHEQQQQTQE